MTSPPALPDHVQAVPLDKAYRLLNHGPVTLVTSAHGERSNVMAAAWVMPLDFSPPKVAVVVDKYTLTRQLIEASGVFALNLPATPQAAATVQVGTHSGLGLSAEHPDKWSLSGLQTFHPETDSGSSPVPVPLVEGCLGWLYCRVCPEPRNQQVYDLFIGEVVAAWADARVFHDGRWHFDAAPGTDGVTPTHTARTLHYVAGGTFFETGRALTVGTPQAGS